MDFVQIYYLIFAPLAGILLINIAFQIFQRPAVHNIPLSDSFLFIMVVLSAIICSIGVGIHSTSTSVYQAFLRDKRYIGQEEDEIEKNQAFLINEKYHGNLSHNLTYLGGIFVWFFIALLEVNHPNTKGILPLTDDLIVAVGIVIGTISSLAVLWSAYSGFNIGIVLISTFLTSLLLYLFAYPDMHTVVAYPMSYAMFLSLLTMFSLLALVTLIFIASERLSHRLVKRAFPKGHAAHEELHWKLLSLKIKRDWFE